MIKKIAIKKIEGSSKDDKKQGVDAPSKKALFVLAPRDFRDEEYFEPKKILSDAGIKTVTASLMLGDLQGMKGARTKGDILIVDANTNDYDAIIFVGGSGAQVLWNNPAAQKLAKDSVAANKILGAICLAPNTLGKAGVLKGKKVTGFPSIKGELSAAGANFTGRAVEQDGNIITGSGPEAANEFGLALLKALK
ncbi:MAG: DJ-1/PfpI family protein [Elusimicrobia bacterium]|nr:DJ-1/PfpI family protein [Candidatus Liberimonas magnetica]